MTSVSVNNASNPGGSVPEVTEHMEQMEIKGENRNTEVGVKPFTS